MVKFKNVTKKFGNSIALDKIDFEIASGEFVFITGPSGSGKTTILNLILNKIAPTFGDVYVNDVKTEELDDKTTPIFRQKIGTVFQDFKLLPERTVRENIEVALAVVGVDSSQWLDRVKHVLKLVGVSRQINNFPSQLSGGELQRVSMARALVVNPDLILADEPTGNLDSKTSESIMEIFEKINKEGKTVIMATHNLDLVKKHKKRILHIEDGKLTSEK